MTRVRSTASQHNWIGDGFDSRRGRSCAFDNQVAKFGEMFLIRSETGAHLLLEIGKRNVQRLDTTFQALDTAAVLAHGLGEFAHGGTECINDRQHRAIVRAVSLQRRDAGFQFFKRGQN